MTIRKIRPPDEKRVPAGSRKDAAIAPPPSGFSLAASFFVLFIETFCGKLRRYPCELRADFIISAGCRTGVNRLCLRHLRSRIGLRIGRVRSQGLRVACRAAAGTIPAVEVLRHVQPRRPAPAMIATSLQSLRNMAVESHAFGPQQANCQSVVQNIVLRLAEAVADGESELRSLSMARRSARASGDQLTAMRSGAASSLTASGRIRGGFRSAGCPLHERVKHGRGPARRRSLA